MPPVIVCPACDLAHRSDAAPQSQRMQCVRCSGPLQRPATAAIDTGIALAASTLVLLVLSNLYPLVAMRVNGSSRETTLMGAAHGLHAQGFDSLAVLVFLTTVIAPLLQILTLLYVLLPLRRGRQAPGQHAALRVLTQIRPWSFVEVFMLGTLVALVRLAKFADIVPGVSLWSSVLLMMSLSALTSITTPEQLWRWVEGSRR
jgi:paraquat-inducible protein A